MLDRIFAHPMLTGVWCYVGLIYMGVLMFIGSDIYMPILPGMACDFADDGSRSCLIASAFLGGVGWSQLIYGPLSDRYGRRPMLQFGLWLASLASIWMLWATDLSTVIMGRLLQGVGMGATLSVSRSMFRDLYQGQRLAQAIAVLGVVIASCTVLAPLLGAYVYAGLGWRGVSSVLLGLLVVGLYLAHRVLPETCQHPHAELQWRLLCHHYMQVVKHPVFAAHVFIATMGLSALTLLFMLVPFVYRQVFHVSLLEGGWWLSVFTGMQFVGKLSNAFLVQHVSMHSVLQAGVVVMLLAAMGLCTLFSHPSLTPWWLAGPIGLFCLGLGWIFPNAFAVAMQAFADKAGYAGAVYGFIQMFVSYLSAYVIVYFNFSSIQPLVVVLVVAAVSSVMALIVHRRIHPSLIS